MACSLKSCPWVHSDTYWGKERDKSWGSTQVQCLKMALKKLNWGLTSTPRHCLNSIFIEFLQQCGFGFFKTMLKNCILQDRKIHVPTSAEKVAQLLGKHALQTRYQQAAKDPKVKLPVKHQQHKQYVTPTHALQWTKPHSDKHIKYQLLQQVKITRFTPAHNVKFTIHPNKWMYTSVTASTLKLRHGVL